ncbi:MAG TPA: hypothetical protein VGP24_12830 [Glaciihabitans sp.]|jgi:hypothetical protein|nr:hypothetical protein [Glaciihabitans sp.]
MAASHIGFAHWPDLQRTPVLGTLGAALAVAIAHHTKWLICSVVSATAIRT